MRKYFYIKDGKKKGPFSLEELNRENLTRKTKVWFYGLNNWTVLSEIEELKSLASSIPPLLKITKSEKNRDTIIIKKDISKINSIKKKLNNRKIINISIFIIVALLLLFSIIKSNFNKRKVSSPHQEIVENAYDSDVNFEFYVKKFYRDINFYGIFPKKPKITIIKFSRLDQLVNTTHIHGLSYGMNDDDRIEIYINPSTWESFNKPMRYILMYHELSHDVLNVDDLEATHENKGKLMYPAISTYEHKTMDDFIESSHVLFKEVAAKQNY